MTDKHLEDMYHDMDDTNLMNQVYLRLVNTAYMLKILGYEQDASANTAIAKIMAKRFEI